MRFSHLMLVGIAFGLLGCGASKGTQKGTDDQLKTITTSVGKTGVPLPPGAVEKNSTLEKTGGVPGSKEPGQTKGGPPVNPG